MRLSYKIPPWVHQLKAIDKAKDMPHFALFFEQGCGKTGALINLLRYKYGIHHGILKTLILCPPIVVRNWVHEITLHSTIPDSKITALEGSQKLRLQTFKDSKNSIFITNYESLLMEELYDSFKEFGFKVLVCDESHKLKNLKSKRTKRAIKLSKETSYRYILSGTPIINSPEDIFSQYLFMDQGATFGKSYPQFREEYFEDLNARMPTHVYFPKWVPQEGAFARLNDKIQSSSFRTTKAECLDLPPLVRQKVFVELSAQQRRIYDTLEREFVAELSKGYVVADLEITKALRLQQIVTGYVTNDQKEEVTFQDNPRLTALQELLNTIPQTSKIIIWSVFRQNVRQLSEFLRREKILFLEAHGAIDTITKQENCKRFNTDDAVRVLLGHPRSAGIGINLTSASYSIFYSRSFSLEDDLQAESRNHRAGSEIHDKITRIDIVTPHTIDEVIVNALEKKLNISEAIINHLKRRG